MKAVIKYDRESLSIEDVLGSLRSKDLEIKFERKFVNVSIQVRGKTEKRN